MKPGNSTNRAVLFTLQRLIKQILKSRGNREHTINVGFVLTRAACSAPNVFFKPTDVGDGRRGLALNTLDAL